MSKSHVREMMNVISALFRDAKVAFPTLVGDFVRDEVRLRAQVENRGIGALCVDLVAAGKYLDRCLSSGQYKPSGLPLTKRCPGGVAIPQFLRGLYLLVFDRTGVLKEDCNVEAVVFLRQILFVARKAKLDCSAANIQKEVLEFAEVDSKLPVPHGFWSSTNPDTCNPYNVTSTFCGDELYRSRVDAHANRDDLRTFLTNLDKVSRIVACALGEYNPSNHKFKHGPGAVSNRDKYSNKYCWNNWSQRLETSFPIADYGFHSYSSWADNYYQAYVGSSEPHSKLIAVPKTFKRPRLIACESAENQWCQQNIWHYFSHKVASCWIGTCLKFRDQSRNQMMCLRGSEDGTYATVDLSAASDRVTCHIVGLFFRHNVRLLNALQSTRTRFLHQAINKDVDSVIELRKFSTMGSACTFPIQSLLFLSISLACVATKRNMQVNSNSLASLAKEVAVFGDDIIIPEDSRELLFDALGILHFQVNSDKSFWTGRFRESCGVDAFRGVNVTPAYWRAPNDGKPESIAMTLDVHNNFHKKFLMHTCKYIATTIQCRHVAHVQVGSGVQGLASFVPPLSPPIKRYNSVLQRDEVKILTVNSTVRRSSISDDTALLQYFTEDPDPYSSWTSGTAQKPKFNLKLRWVQSSDLLNRESLGSETKTGEKDVSGTIPQIVSGS